MKKYNNYINEKIKLTDDEWFNAIENLDIVQIKKMIDNGFDTALNKNVALHLLCSDDNVEYEDTFLTKKHIKIIKLLLDNGANVNLKNHDGYTVLHLIAYVDNPLTPQVIKLLLDARIDINIRWKNGASPLIFASEYQIMRNVYTLIKNGADWFIEDDDNNMFLDYLSDSNKEKIKKKYPEKYKDYLKRKQVKKFKI